MVMGKNVKEWIQYGSAIIMLASGVILAFLSFFLNAYKIDDSILWYVSQCLVYAGSIFGISVYVRSKFSEIENKIKTENK